MAIQRPKSADQKFQEAVALRNQQAANLAALREQQSRVASATSRMAVLEQEAQSANDTANASIALESLAEQNAPVIGRRRAIEALGQFKNVGREKLWNKAIFEMVYESLWVDDEVKAAEVRPMYEAFCDTLGFLRKVSPRAFQTPKTALKTTLEAAINATVDRAYGRTSVLFEAAADQNTWNDKIFDKLSFNITDEEEAEFDEKLTDMGKTDVVNAVKKKVLTVIQEEQKEAEKKASMFQELDEAANPKDEEEDENEEDTNTEETSGEEDTGEEASSDEGTEDTGEEETSESAVIMMLESGLSYTYGDFLALLEADDKIPDKGEPIIEVDLNANPKLNMLAKTLLRLCHISDREASDPKAVRDKVREIMVNPNTSDNVRYNVACVLLGILGYMVTLGVGVATAPVLGVFGITVGWALGMVVMFTMFCQDSGQVAKIKNIKKQLLDIRRRTPDKETQAKIDKNIEACDNAIMRLQGTQVQMKVESELPSEDGETKEDKPTFEQLLLERKIREANTRGISSVFEGFLIFNREAAIREVAHTNQMNSGAVMESVAPSLVTQSAFMQTLVQYTTLETLNTLRYIDLTKSDMNNVMEAMTKIDKSLAGTAQDTTSGPLTLCGQWDTLPDSRRVTGQYGPRLM